MVTAGNRHLSAGEGASPAIGECGTRSVFPSSARDGLSDRARGRSACTLRAAHPTRTRLRPSTRSCRQREGAPFDRRRLARESGPAAAAYVLETGRHGLDAHGQTIGVRRTMWRSTCPRRRSSQAVELQSTILRSSRTPSSREQMRGEYGSRTSPHELSLEAARLARQIHPSAITPSPGAQRAC